MRKVLNNIPKLNTARRYWKTDEVVTNVTTHRVKAMSSTAIVR